MLSSLDSLRGLTAASVLLRLACAMLFGGMIGLERGRKHRAAGFRTYMFVCMGSALTGILSQYLYIMLTTVWSADAALVGRTTDVSRIGAKVISGVGFLGAGTIIVTEHQEVEGVTTAAGLWASACMGLAIGAGFYECAVLGVVLLAVCIQLLPHVEYAIIERSRNMNLFVEFTSLEELGGVLACIKTQDVQVYEVDLSRGAPDSSRRPSAVFSIRLNRSTPHEQILSALSEVRGVTAIDEI